MAALPSISGNRPFTPESLRHAFSFWIPALRNWLVLNFCALVPLWTLALGWLPDQIKVSVPAQGNLFVSVLVGGDELLGTAYGGSRDIRLWHFHLPRDVSVSQLSFQISGQRGKNAIRRIELQKWHLFAFELDLDRLEPRETSTLGYVFHDPRFIHVSLASPGLAWGLAAIQAVLAAVSWLAAKFRPRISLRSSVCPAIAAATVFSLFWHLVLPLQTYWGNASAFPFPLSGLLASAFLRFAATAIAGTFALMLLVACFGIVVSWLVVAISLGLHLEAGFLSIGLPPLNGDWHFYANGPRAIWDSLVWVALFASAWALSRTPRKALPIAAASLSLWMGLSLFDVRHERTTDTAKLLVSDFISLSEIPDTLSYAPRQNILVFVLDSLEREQARAAIHDPQEGPSLQAAFEGFTEFADNLGAASSSGYAVANMFTGDYFEPGDSALDFFMSVFSSHSVLKDFLDAGWGVHLATSSIGMGYANRAPRTDSPPPAADKTIPSPDRPMKGAMPWSLADICRFRSMPFAFRFRYLHLLSRELPHYSFTREWSLYPRLAAAPVSPDTPGTFLFVHTEGVHVPVMHDRQGNLLAFDRNTDKGCVDMAVFLFRQLAGLFDVYRAMGIYDDAFILVLADHGNHENNQRSLPATIAAPLPGNARPFLWVKPPHSRHPFESSFAPTSHARIHTLLRQAMRFSVPGGDLLSLLRMDTRLYQSISNDGTAVDDWLVLPDGSCVRDGNSSSRPSSR